MKNQMNAFLNKHKNSRIRWQGNADRDACANNFKEYISAANMAKVNIKEGKRVAMNDF